MKLVSWDAHNINDGTNYEAILEAGVYGLPGIDPELGLRQGAWPLIAGIKRPGKMIHVDIYIRGAAVGTLQKQLAQWFDPDDETPKKLIGQDAGGGNTRYIMGVCVELAEVPFGAGLHFVISIQVHDDVMWRETSLTTPSVWNVTASGQTRQFTNNGENDAYPIIKISPQGAKTSSWPYKRFIVVKWRGQGTATNYPVDITNALLDTQIASTNFALANGNDLRVWMDGTETDRWLDGINTATTSVWVNFDWETDIPLTLDGALSIVGTSVQVNESINNMPSSGIIRIDSETIVYNSKSNATKTFNNCTRGAKGSTAATHTDTTAVFWLQHDIWILYGKASAGTPTIDDDYKPIFSLVNSTNISWDYDNFRETDGWSWKPRAGAWQTQGILGVDFYTGNQGGYADPAVEVGIYTNILNASGVIYVVNPVGITVANFQNGERRSPVLGEYNFSLASSLGVSAPTYPEYTIPWPTVIDTWQTWSRSESLRTGSKSVGIYLSHVDSLGDLYCEASDVTLTLNSSYTPVTVIGAEQGNYLLGFSIQNNTAPMEWLWVTYVMALTDEIEVNTDAKTVIDLEDNSNQFQALTLGGDPRRDWLILKVGVNNLQVWDDGVTDLDITLTWEERHYQ